MTCFLCFVHVVLSRGGSHGLETSSKCGAMEGKPGACDTSSPPRTKKSRQCMSHAGAICCQESQGDGSLWHFFLSRVCVFFFLFPGVVVDLGSVSSLLVQCRLTKYDIFPVTSLSGRVEFLDPAVETSPSSRRVQRSL